MRGLLNTLRERAVGLFLSLFMSMAALLVTAHSSQLLAAMPSLPCEDTLVPPYSWAGAEPAVEVWNGAEAADWVPPACSGWTGQSKEIIAIAGSFQSNDNLPALLSKIGAVSNYPQIIYWTVTSKRWRSLIAKASALTDLNPIHRRPDFTPEELVPSAQLYALESEDRTGPVVYRMAVKDLGSDRATIETVNMTSIKFHFLELMRPQTLQTLEYVRRLGSDRWGVYLITRTTKDAGALAGDQQASYINRSVALFRYIAGIQMDKEPPAAR